MLPEPVVKVPVPVWRKLPKLWVILFPTDRVEDRVVAPVTARVLPRTVGPLLTVKAPVPVTVVLPLSEILPVPVLNDPVPLCEKLPNVWERSFPKVEVPATDKVPPKVVAPVPTVKVFEPETEVLPLRVTPPVPVENVPVPD